MENRQLLDYGLIKPEKKGLSKFEYPKRQLLVMRNVARKLASLIEVLKPDQIVLEEINRHLSRKSGKILDGMHFILLEYLPEWALDIVIYCDSDGTTGWRTRLNLRLTEDDKKSNAINSKINKKKAKGTPDLVIINKKHLAARVVNSTLGTRFDVDTNPSDSDVVDAIGLGLAWFLTHN